MKKIWVALALLGGSLCFAETLVYQGQSNISHQGRRDCLVTLNLNQQKQIQAVDFSGPAEKWEILADTPDGARPKKEIVYVSGDELLSDAKTFANFNFQKKPRFLSEGFKLVSQTPFEGVFKAVFDLDFEIQTGKLVSVHFNSKYKALLFKVASQDFQCHSLVRKAIR